MTILKIFCKKIL
uniref:Uncharacterized protein n=1 Tax=Rhizophora mucronata TaxID=61149 RepID=A0A2P2JMD6_RHIMU